MYSIFFKEIIKYFKIYLKKNNINNFCGGANKIVGKKKNQTGPQNDPYC